jgi:GNAT superfamily N-acetyltransferase
MNQSNDTINTIQGIELRGAEGIDVATFVDVLVDSSLGERRPVADGETMAAMLRHGNLLVSAWEGERVVGIARTLTDFRYVGYLSDLAVRRSHQRRGIGAALIAETRLRMGPAAHLVLLAAPKAVDYYPHLGFRRHESAWILQATDPVPVRPEPEASP